MGAFCVGCGTKNASGTETGDELLVRFPQGCHVCSRAHVGPKIKYELTHSNLAAKIKELGYAFIDMEGEPLRPKKKGNK